MLEPAMKRRLFVRPSKSRPSSGNVVDAIAITIPNNRVQRTITAKPLRHMLHLQTVFRGRFRPRLVTAVHRRLTMLDVQRLGALYSEKK
jgi:hypothetical protein